MIKLHCGSDNVTYQLTSLQLIRHPVSVFRFCSRIIGRLAVIDCQLCKAVFPKLPTASLCLDQIFPQSRHLFRSPLQILKRKLRKRLFSFDSYILVIPALFEKPNISPSICFCNKTIRRVFGVVGIALRHFPAIFILFDTVRARGSSGDGSSPFCVVVAPWDLAPRTRSALG